MHILNKKWMKEVGGISTKKYKKLRSLRKSNDSCPQIIFQLLLQTYDIKAGKIFGEKIKRKKEKNFKHPISIGNSTRN
ncbi:unnamed protein product [Meloidogyne enterolobii]|uniref:Uncharacterized protein n=1 Tax=Meloidogyne enterolobii TaxID=390850 RepID=A0ACB0Z304_MELEN